MSPCNGDIEPCPCDHAAAAWCRRFYIEDLPFLPSTQYFGYSGSSYLDNYLQRQYLVPKGPPYTENHRIKWQLSSVTLLPMPTTVTVTEVLCLRSHLIFFFFSSTRPTRVSFSFHSSALFYNDDDWVNRLNTTNLPVNKGVCVDVLISIM